MCFSFYFKDLLWSVSLPLGFPSLLIPCPDSVHLCLVSSVYVGASLCRVVCVTCIPAFVLLSVPPCCCFPVFVICYWSIHPCSSQSGLLHFLFPFCSSWILPFPALVLIKLPLVRFFFFCLVCVWVLSSWTHMTHNWESSSSGSHLLNIPFLKSSLILRIF